MADKYLRHKPTGIMYIWQPAFAQNPEFEEADSLEPKAAKAPKAPKATKAPKTAAAPADAGGAGGEGDGSGGPDDTDDDADDSSVVALTGSDLYPAMMAFGTKELSLGDVVRRAHAESGLSASAWNALEQPVRDEAIMLTVGRLQAEAAEADQAASEDASRNLK
jgi:hypothetical protein